jgi:hypothetical protein
MNENEHHTTEGAREGNNDQRKTSIPGSTNKMPRA